MALIMASLRTIGWEPLAPDEWRDAEGGTVWPANLEQTAAAVGDALRALRWTSLAARREDYVGAGRGVDEDTTFRGPRKHWGSARRGEFGRRLCILSGGTWTQDRRARAGQGQALCPHCGQEPETVIHRWWRCPKWEQERLHPGDLDLAAMGEKAEWQPACLWHCGVLPALTAQHLPPQPPPCDTAWQGEKHDAQGVTIYTDGSAMCPKDKCMRRAAYAIWLGDDHPANAAAPLPGRVQTVFRAELAAVVHAAERTQGDCEIVSDCQGVAFGAQAHLDGDSLDPLCRHADLWARFRAAAAARQGRIRRVRWVPAHRPRGSPDISPEDWYGNHQADQAANAAAQRAGPTGDQLRRHLAAQELCVAVQEAQARVMAAVMRAEEVARTTRGARLSHALAPRRTAAGHRSAAPTHMQPAERRTWGEHFVRGGQNNAYVCVFCRRYATGSRWKRALQKMPCIPDRPGPGELRGQAREHWSEAWASKMALDDRAKHGGHQVQRYNTTGHDGRWICVDCGRHCVKRRELAARPCAGEPQDARAWQALDDFQAGRPLRRAKVRCSAVWPAGATHLAAGPRQPGFDRGALAGQERPKGPAHPSLWQQAEDQDGQPPAAPPPVGLARFGIRRRPAPGAGQQAGPDRRSEGEDAGADPPLAEEGLARYGIRPAPTFRRGLRTGRRGPRSFEDSLASLDALRYQPGAARDAPGQGGGPQGTLGGNSSAGPGAAAGWPRTPADWGSRLASLDALRFRPGAVGGEHGEGFGLAAGSSETVHAGPAAVGGPPGSSNDRHGVHGRGLGRQRDLSGGRNVPLEPD